MWLFIAYYESKICLSNEGISSEEIIESGVDVVFMKAADDENLYTRLNECGIATIDCQFDTYEELQTVVKMIASVLGTDEASQKAEAYCLYLDDAVADTIAFSDTLGEDDRVSALVMKDTKDYSAYGSGRYTGKWVEMCGANYSMVNEDTYANVNLTSEQIFEYNPNFIFFAMPKQVDKFLEDGTWSDLDAVQNDHVYNIPGGFNTWSNCGAESAARRYWSEAPVKLTGKGLFSDFMWVFRLLEGRFRPGSWRRYYLIFCRSASRMPCAGEGLIIGQWNRLSGWQRIRKHCGRYLWRSNGSLLRQMVLFCRERAVCQNCRWQEAFRLRHRIQ